MKMRVDHKKSLALLGLYVLVGIVAGVGAILFQQLLSFVNIHVMEGLSGYQNIKIVQGLRRLSLPWPRPPLRVWLFPLLAGLGGLLTGILVYKLAPEAAGHGTDEVIDSYHHKDGEVKLRVSLVKMLASALTLGTGGSGGKEGPIAQIGAGFGSFICSKWTYFRAYRKEIMLAGMAAGIAAIFRAPLAGSLLAAEILHSDMRYDGRVLIPAGIASAVSYGVYALYFGFSPVFSVPDFTYEFALRHLLPFTIIGIVSAGGAIVFVKIFYGLRNLFRRIPIKSFLKPALGGVVTGLIAMGVPEALGEGSFELQHLLEGRYAFWFIALLLLAKILTTSFSIGSGGSGGIFGPSLFVGAALGGLFAALHALGFPESDLAPTVFVLLGMVAFFSGAANAPVSTVIIVAEMTGVFSLLVPSIWVSIIAYVFSQRWNIYENQAPISQNILEIIEEEPLSLACTGRHESRGTAFRVGSVLHADAETGAPVIIAGSQIDGSGSI